VGRARWEYHFFTLPAITNAGDFDPGTGLPVDQVRDAVGLSERYRARYAAELAQLGEDGWELTTSHLVPFLFDEVTPGAILMIFKRPLM
jgi:hypothetical protein